VTAEEWRVEVDLDDEEHGYGLSERLRSRDLDDEARERLGRRVAVTRDGPRLFLYAGTEQQAHEAERVVRELLEADGLTAEIRVTRWDDQAEAWVSAEAREATPEQREAKPEDSYDWLVRIHLPNRADAAALAERLEAEGLSVHRLWGYVEVDARTKDEADELATRLRRELPEPEVWVDPNPDDIPSPVFVLLESRLRDPF
jgi:hypothetical protein